MYVVTGATGNTGAVIVDRLLASGQKVRAIGRNADRLKGVIKKGAEPFICDVTDVDLLAKAFAGARVAYIMIPPDMSAADIGGYQSRVSKAAVTAIQRAGIQHVVSLSSIGADKSDKTGLVVGLHRMEEQLNRVAGLNVIHLRPAYFMENTLAQIGIIHAMGMAAGPLRADLSIPMITTRDIGVAAAEAMLQADFSGQQIRDLLGPRDISMNEAASIIGKAIGKPDLKYVALPDAQIRQSLKEMGMSDSGADSLLELSAALNSGHIRGPERSSKNSTPTSYETFVKEEFVPLYAH